MAFSIPKNVPSFSNPNRAFEDHLWAAAGSATRGTNTISRGSTSRFGGCSDSSTLVQNVQGFFDGARPNRGGTLPLYKDKPYTYATSRRVHPAWRHWKKIALLVSVLVLAGILLSGVWRMGGSVDERNAAPLMWLRGPKAGLEGDRPVVGLPDVGRTEGRPVEGVPVKQGPVEPGPAEEEHRAEEHPAEGHRVEEGLAEGSRAGRGHIEGDHQVEGDRVEGTRVEEGRPS